MPQLRPGCSFLRAVLHRITHLYGSVQHCLTWPKAMDKVTNFASFFALDVLKSARIPCVFTSFDYFDRVRLVIAAPFAVAFVVTVSSVILQSVSALYHDADLEGLAKAIKKGYWAAVPVVLFLMDLLHPAVTRVLCQYFSCRNMGVAGFWLSSDYNVSSDSFRNNILYNTNLVHIM